MPVPPEIEILNFQSNVDNKNSSLLLPVNQPSENVFGEEAEQFEPYTFPNGAELMTQKKNRRLLDFLGHFSEDDPVSQEMVAYLFKGDTSVGSRRSISRRIGDLSKQIEAQGVPVELGKTPVAYSLNGKEVKTTDYFLEFPSKNSDAQEDLLHPLTKDERMILASFWGYTETEHNTQIAQEIVSDYMTAKGRYPSLEEYATLWITGVETLEKIAQTRKEQRLHSQVDADAQELLEKGFASTEDIIRMMFTLSQNGDIEGEWRNMLRLWEDWDSGNAEPDIFPPLNPLRKIAFDLRGTNSSQVSNRYEKPAGNGNGYNRREYVSTQVIYSASANGNGFHRE